MAGAKIRESGFENLHQYVPAADLPDVTDAVYDVMEAYAPSALERRVPGLFNWKRNFYFETSPNIRFHIPYKCAAAHRKQFDAFAEKFGQGKIAPHGPHRDSWLDCPTNAINIWIAIGRVRPGNGLTVFPHDYGRQLAFQPNGELEDGQRLSPPLTFDLAPGDAVVFHGDHVHGSELNRLEETRYVVSFRMTLDKPRFHDGHYHHYRHSGMAMGGWGALSGLPANLQASFFKSFAKRGFRKLTGYKPAPRNGAAQAGTASANGAAIPLADFPEGSIKAVSNAVCVARIGADRFEAFSRFCPHSGADLANGWLKGDRLVCPWHNLPFDLTSKKSECEALAPLKAYGCRVENDVLHVEDRLS